MKSDETLTNHNIIAAPLEIAYQEYSIFCLEVAHDRKRMDGNAG